MATHFRFDTETFIKHVDLYFVVKPPPNAKDDDDVKVADAAAQPASIPMSVALAMPALELPRQIEATNLLETSFGGASDPYGELPLESLSFRELLQYFYMSLARDLKNKKLPDATRAKFEKAFAALDEVYRPHYLPIRNYAKNSEEALAALSWNESDQFLRNVLFPALSKLTEFELDRLLDFLYDDSATRQKRIYARVPDLWPVHLNELIPGTNHILQPTDLGPGQTVFWMQVLGANEANGIDQRSFEQADTTGIVLD